MKNLSSSLLGIIVAIIFLASSVIYIVDERQQAVLFQLGRLLMLKLALGYISKYRLHKTYSILKIVF